MTKQILGCMVVVTAMLAQSAFRSDVPKDRAALGKLLFFDPILSRDRTISCASCHKPGLAFADSVAFSTGVGGKRGVRNSPTAMNLALRNTNLFWDGRAATLEIQALKPIEDHTEMDLPLGKAISRLRSDSKYRSYFMRIYNRLPDTSSLADAIASFERTLETSESPFDEWKYTGDSTLVSDAVKRGFELFSGKGKCVRCHFGADFTANEFRNIGLFDGKKLNDSGRAIVTGLAGDIGRFKTSSLRNLAVTAPYMHNGMFKTLEEVIDFYEDPSKQVPAGINRDTLLAKPLGLTAQDKSDLKAFLLSLTDKRYLDQSDRKADN